MDKFYDSVVSVFTGGDQLPWCDRDIVLGCEKEVAEAGNGVSEEIRNDTIMRLSWALVHSKQPDDVQRGMAMLEDSLVNPGSPLQKREKFYLLAVGRYRSGDYSRSRQLLERCLEIAPNWGQALALKKAVEDKIAKDGLIGIGLSTAVLGLMVGGLVAALTRLVAGGTAAAIVMARKK